MKWINNIPEHWQSVKIDGDGIPDTVKLAGVYGDSCDVYANFSIAMVRNWHRLIELHALEILSRCQEECNATLTYDIRSRVKRIVDDICASVPYHVEDMMGSSSLIHVPKVRFPFTRIPSPSALKTRSYPKSVSQHERQIIYPGAMAIYRVLLAVLMLTRTDGKKAYTALETDQRHWISGQIYRLELLLKFPQ